MKFDKELRKSVQLSFHNVNTMDPHIEQVKYSRTKVQEIDSQLKSRIHAESGANYSASFPDWLTG